MAGKMKAVTGVWESIGVSDLNRILKPHGVRLIRTTKKAWGDAVSITAHAIEAPVVNIGVPMVVDPPAGDELAEAGARHNAGRAGG